MTDMEHWIAAWKNIQADYISGKITRAQFVKERNYMWTARWQILQSEHDK